MAVDDQRRLLRAVEKLDCLPSESHEYSSLATLTRSPSVMTDITDEWASLAQSEEHEVEAALLSASITDEQLSVLAGTREFESVKFLQCAVDSEFVPLSCLGERLPALEQLKLNGSSLPSLRYLGTSMTQLRVLWLCRCGLQELDNLGALPQLQELYLAFNDISQLSPLTEADELQVLDLEANSGTRPPHGLQ